MSRASLTFNNDAAQRVGLSGAGEGKTEAVGTTVHTRLSHRATEPQPRGMMCRHSRVPSASLRLTTGHPLEPQAGREKLKARQTFGSHSAVTFFPTRGFHGIVRNGAACGVSPHSPCRWSRCSSLRPAKLRALQPTEGTGGARADGRGGTRRPAAPLLSRVRPAGCLHAPLMKV